MNAINNLEFQQNNESSLSATSNTNSSIEDDIMIERLRMKQCISSLSSDKAIFAIDIVHIDYIGEKITCDLARRNILNFDDECDEKFNARNTSFITADSSMRNSIEMCVAKNRDFSLLSGIEFDKTMRASTSTQKSEKNSREVQQKILLGLSALTSTMNKVQTKDVAFKFAHLKIFAQLNALKKIKTESPKKSSSKLRLPDKKKEFYRQWFKNNKVNQEVSCETNTDTHHTLIARK